MNKTITTLAILLASLVLTFINDAAHATAPNVLTYQGRLLESGSPVSGARTVDVRVCDSLTGGLCYDTGAQSVGVQNGVFKTTFTLATTPALPAEGLGGGTWFLEVQVNAVTLSPREPLTSHPYAVFSSTAETLGVPSASSPGVTISTNVGIGTAPLAQLHVLSSVSGRPQVLVQSAGATGAELRVAGGPAGSDAVLTLDRPDSAGSSWVDLRQAGTSRWQMRLEPTASSSRFDVNETVNGTPTPRATVLRGGRVGIGLTGPTAQLHVSSASATNADALLKVSSGPSFGQEVFTVGGDGLVGIGTTMALQVPGTGAPRLEVNGAANVVGQLSVNGGSGFAAPLTVAGTISASGSLNLVGPGSALSVAGNGGVNAGIGGVTTSSNVTVTGGGIFSGDGSGLSNVMRVVSSTTLSGVSANMTLGLPAVYGSLRVIIRVAGLSSSGNLHLRFNGDSGANYALARLTNGSQTTAVSQTEINVFTAAYGTTAVNMILDIPNNVAAAKQGMLVASDYSNATTVPGQVELRWVYGAVGSPISSITVTPTAGNLLAGSQIIAYGSGN